MIYFMFVIMHAIMHYRMNMFVMLNCTVYCYFQPYVYITLFNSVIGMMHQVDSGFS